MRNLLFFCLVLFFHVATAQSWKSLQDKAAAACESGNFKSAIDLSGQAITAAGKDRKADPQEVLSLRSENASYYLLDEQVAKGEELFGRILGELNSQMPVAEMNVSQNYGVALMFLSQYSKALPYLQRAVELFTAGNMKTKDRVAVLGSLAVCYQHLYDYEKSERTLNAAIDMAMQSDLKNTSDAASLFSARALLYRDLMRPVDAEADYGRAEKIFLNSADTLNPLFPVFLSEYGTFLAEQNLLTEAEQRLKRAQALDLGMFGEQSTQYASELNNLGYLYDKMQRYAEAEACYNQSLDIKKKLPYTRISELMTGYSNVLHFLYSKGRDKKARELALKVEEGLKNPEFTDTLKRAVFCNNLAVFFKDWNDFDKSFYYYDEALKYYTAIYGAVSAPCAEIYMSLAVNYLILSDWKKMTESLEKGTAIYKQVPLENSVDAIYTMCNLVTMLRELEQPLQALEYSEQAETLVEKLQVTDGRVLELVWYTRAMALADLKRQRESAIYFQKYLDLRYRNIQLDFSYMTEEEKLEYITDFEDYISEYYSLIAKTLPQNSEQVSMLLNFRLRTKSLLFNNMNEIRQRIRQKNDPALTSKFADMVLKRETVASLMRQGGEAELKQAETLTRDADLLEKEISRTLSLELRKNNMDITWKDVQKSLQPGEAAIEVFRESFIYDNDQGLGVNYTYIILRAQGEPVAVTIDRPINWEKAVLTHYRNSIQKKTNDGSVYVRLWQFLSAQLADCQTVFLSPDGLYNQVNVNTLFNSQTSKFVLEEKNVHLVESLRSIAEARKKMPMPKSALLAGNPDFNKSAAVPQQQVASVEKTRSPYDFFLSDLPATKEEVEGISGILKQAGLTVTVLTGAEANETNVRKVHSPGILHLATHGFFMKDVSKTALLTASAFEKEYYRNPMLRSGVFFSGANIQPDAAQSGRPDDGMLTAMEAMNLDLSGTSLVVLSACETGLGEVQNGEGVFGLQRAMRLAGASGVMMSLWPVSDETTMELMKEFYKLWMQNGDAYAAFRQAQLNVRQKYPEPVYWGAFVMMGR